jgi:hypothetical protein
VPVYGYYVFPKPSVHGFPTVVDPADRSCRYLVQPPTVPGMARLWGYRAHRVEVEVGADGHASAPLSGTAAAAPPAGADVCIYIRTMEEHLEHLRRLLQRFKEEGLKLRVKKCLFGFQEMLLRPSRNGISGLYFVRW